MNLHGVISLLLAVVAVTSASVASANDSTQIGAFDASPETNSTELYDSSDAEADADFAREDLPVDIETEDDSADAERSLEAPVGDDKGDDVEANADANAQFETSDLDLPENGPESDGGAERSLDNEIQPEDAEDDVSAETESPE